MTNKLKKMRVKDDIVLFSKRNDNRLICAQYNAMVDYIEQLERRVAKLEREARNE